MPASAPALLAFLACPLLSCSGGGDAELGARVHELEGRVVALEQRLAAAPAESAGLDAAPFDEIARRLESRDVIERVRAGQALASRLPEFRIDALRLLQAGSVRQRESVAIVLATRSTEDMVHGLLLALETATEPRVRIWVNRALGHAGSSEATSALIADLAHADEGVRVSAAAALGRLGDPRAAAPLVALITSSTGVASQAAADALVSLGDLVAPHLEATWASHGPRERRAIIRALAPQAGHAVSDFLKERLQDPSALVALEAARVLGSRGDMAGRDLAMERLRSEDPSVAEAARLALDAIENAP